MSDTPSRQSVAFSFSTQDGPKRTVRITDRITIDEVYRHLVNREIYRVVTGDDPGIDINRNFVDFLVIESLVTR